MATSFISQVPKSLTLPYCTVACWKRKDTGAQRTGLKKTRHHQNFIAASLAKAVDHLATKLVHHSLPISIHNVRNTKHPRLGLPSLPK